MKRLHRNPAQVKQALRNKQAANAFLATKFEEVVAWAQARYGHLFTTSWMYDDEGCPCCGKRRVAIWETHGQYTVSLNTFLYNEQHVLIGYVLCPVCAVELMKTSPSRKVALHQQIERCLMTAYQRTHAATAPPPEAERST